MGEWLCSTCKVKMEEVDDIQIFYGEVDLPDALGIRCPSCGQEYLLEQFVTDELIAAEEMLEGK